jgi:ATP-dependent Clp protease ATP-binding subunit ClpA
MQYGVLLLDEFEKASADVHNVFLQLLDEGFVTDGRGEKIMARNCMIIATSNAGSDRVYEAIAQGKNTATTTESLIEHIISSGLFRPELINRFDGVIVFHPLDTHALRQVAKLLIVELNERLTIKGIKVSPTDALLDHLVLIGNDPTFGARAMRRAIQDEVERVLADGLIAGTISTGSTVQLVVRDGNLLLQ